MARKTYDVIVAGAGIVGLSAACELAFRGAKCLLLDRGRAGREASHAAGGILSPQSEAAPDSPLLPLALRGRDRHLRLARELREETGIDVDHKRRGVLSVAFSAKELSHLRDLTRAQRRLGLEAEMIPKGRLAGLEPLVHPGARGAALFPNDHCVDNRRLLEGLLSLARKRGVTVREGVAVRGIETRQGRLHALRTDAGRIEAPALINALGAWAARLPGDPSPPPVRPVKGHMISLVEGPTLGHVVYGGHGYIVPRTDGRLIVGSTMEEVGFDHRVTAEGVARLLSIAVAVVPLTGKASIAEMWTGLRPATPDGLPVIGPGAVEGLTVAGGLFRNGILLGPLVGEIAARLALGGKSPIDLSAFHPDRFEKTGRLRS